jgi:hypothetical protein
MSIVGATKKTALLAATAATVFSACGVDPTDTSTEPLTATFKEAPHGPLPQVDFHGGAVVANPRLITVTFKNYFFTPEVQAFAKWLPTTNWLSSWGSNYGIQSLTAGGSVAIPTAPPVTDLSTFDAQSYLLSKIADHTLPKPRSGDVLAFYMPGQTGCNLNGGHGQLGYPGVQAEFLLMYDCSQSTSANPDQLATLESTMSHELAEATTDDYGAWNENDPLVNTVAGGEVADMCQFFNVTKQVSGHAFTYMRIWSNKAAAAGTNPCVPVPADDVIYYNVTTPQRIKTVSASKSTKTYTMPITGWSTAARDPWDVMVLPQSGPSTFDATPVLSVSQINNGQTATLSMTVPGGTPSGGDSVNCVWVTAQGWRAYCVEVVVK